jgi:hypothetical protein
MGEKSNRPGRAAKLTLVFMLLFGCTADDD